MWHCLKWKVDSRSASFKVPCLLWCLNVLRLVHNYPPLAPILILLTPVPNFSPYWFKIEFSVIQTTCRTCIWSLSPRVSKWMCLYPSNINIRALHVRRVSRLIALCYWQSACQYSFFFVFQFVPLLGPYWYTEHLVFKTPYFLYVFPHDVRPSFTPT